MRAIKKVSLVLFFTTLVFSYANAMLGGEENEKHSVSYIRDEKLRGKIMMLRIEILQGHKILEAQRLSYEVIVQEKNAIPHSNNPFNQRIASSDIGDVLIDDYDTGAIWLGALDNKDNVIGCTRLTGRRLSDNKLRSQCLVDELPNEISKIENLVELGRTAVKPEYRYKGLVAMKLGVRCLEESLSRNASLMSITDQANAYFLGKTLGAEDINVSSKEYPELKFIFLPLNKMDCSLMTATQWINKYIEKKKFSTILKLVPLDYTSLPLAA